MDGDSHRQIQRVAHGSFRLRQLRLLALSLGKLNTELNPPTE